MEGDCGRGETAWSCWENGSITCFLAGKPGKICMEVKDLELDSFPIPLELLESAPKTPVWTCFKILLWKCIQALLKVVPEQKAVSRSSSQSLHSCFPHLAVPRGLFLLSIHLGFPSCPIQEVCRDTNSWSSTATARWWPHVFQDSVKTPIIYPSFLRIRKCILPVFHIYFYYNICNTVLILFTYLFPLFLYPYSLNLVPKIL